MDDLFKLSQSNTRHAKPLPRLVSRSCEQQSQSKPGSGARVSAHVKVEFRDVRTGQLQRSNTLGEVICYVHTGMHAIIFEGLKESDGKWHMPLSGPLKTGTAQISAGQCAIMAKERGMAAFFSRSTATQLTSLIAAVFALKGVAPPRGMKRPRASCMASLGARHTAPTGLGAVLTDRTNQPSPSSQAKPSHGMAKRDTPALDGTPAQLTPEQAKAVALVKAGKSIMLGGGAGVGKSFTLKLLIAALARRPGVVVTASTALAATALGGITLHAAMGLTPATNTAAELVKNVQARRDATARWHAMRVLVVDEVSMVDAHTLDVLNSAAQHIRRVEKPFGGIQVVMCGDFAQLPPVTHDGEPRFAFQANCWQQLVQHTVQLTKVFRQKDATFARILNEARLGSISAAHAEILAARWRADIPAHLGPPTKIVTHRRDVAAANAAMLTELSGDAVSLHAQDSVLTPRVAEQRALRMLDTSVLAPKELRLKIGARVVLCRNWNTQAGLVNGSTGIVTGFHAAAKYPIVQFHGQAALTHMKPETFEVRDAAGLVASRRQVPLLLAAAISVHKAQGMTLPAVQLSLARVFEAGQAYVALSRSTSLEGVCLQDQFDPACVRAHPAVQEYYAALEASAATVEAVETAPGPALQPHGARTGLHVNA